MSSPLIVYFLNCLDLHYDLMVIFFIIYLTLTIELFVTTRYPLIPRHRLTCCMFLEIHVSSRSSSLRPWYLPVVFTAMNTSDGERCSTGPGGALLRGGPFIALLSRVNFLKYAEKTFPPVAAAGRSTGSPLLGCPTVTTSMPVTSRQVTAVAAARVPADELKVLIDPPAGFHIVTGRMVSQLQSWTEEMQLFSGVHNILHGEDTTHSWKHLCSPVTVRLAAFSYSAIIKSISGQDGALLNQWPVWARYGRG